MKHYPPVGEVTGKKEQIAEMFDAIAPRYDFLNRVMSGGIDRSWRKKAVDLLAAHKPKRILDVATGTGDLAIEAMRLNPDEVVGIDISEQMLEKGRVKLKDLDLADRIKLETGDAEALAYPDGHFDAAMVAFGVRNFENLQKGLQEMNRVLCEGGVLVVLEFSQPRHFPIRQLYQVYNRFVLPTVGRLFSKDKGAYKYLPDSIAAFPYGEAFLNEMRTSGYTNLHAQPLTFGVATLYSGEAG